MLPESELDTVEVPAPPLPLVIPAETPARLHPPLPPEPVSRLRHGFYGPARPAQVAFVSPSLPDIWQCVEASWLQPLTTRAPVAGMVDFFRVQGCTEASRPSASRPTSLYSQRAGQRAGSLCRHWYVTGKCCEATLVMLLAVQD